MGENQSSHKAREERANEEKFGKERIFWELSRRVGGIEISRIVRKVREGHLRRVRDVWRDTERPICVGNERERERTRLVATNEA